MNPKFEIRIENTFDVIDGKTKQIVSPHKELVNSIEKYLAIRTSNLEGFVFVHYIWPQTKFYVTLHLCRGVNKALENEIDLEMDKIVKNISSK